MTQAIYNMFQSGASLSIEDAKARQPLNNYQGVFQNYHIDYSDVLRESPMTDLKCDGE